LAATCKLANQGVWRVRIEDIDPPREVPGAAETICVSWNITAFTGTATFSGSQNGTRLIANVWPGSEQGLSYYCTCTRARIQSVGGVYDGHCRTLGHGPENAAVRLVSIFL
jgi:glutamyl-Q tRNA(Asp) synthetase